MTDYGYGLWALVAIDSLIFIGFAASCFHPRSRRDWKAFGGFSAFVVALFTEMYGVPLTIFLLSGALGDKVGLSHNSGHLLNDLVGWRGNPHLSPFHLASYILIIGGLWLIESAWIRLHRSARADRLATDGPYAHIRHPQYSGFAVIMTGFLLQWPTLLTLTMFPVLLVVYHRLALAEEREVEAVFGRAWVAYALATPRFIPRPRRRPASIRQPEAGECTGTQHDAGQRQAGSGPSDEHASAAGRGIRLASGGHAAVTSVGRPWRR